MKESNYGLRLKIEDVPSLGRQGRAAKRLSKEEVFKLKFKERKTIYQLKGGENKRKIIPGSEESMLKGPEVKKKWNIQETQRRL